MRNQVQLITYPDRLGGSLQALTRLLSGPLGGLFGGIHLLPFFLPYDGDDAGFDPVDHLLVDPRLGGWEDVRRLSRSYDTVVDFIVNHVSARSAQFQDVRTRGDASPYAGMFLTLSRVFPHGATEGDLTRIVRPRPGLPFTPMTLGSRRRLVWTTFTSRQVDLDVQHPQARRYLSGVLRQLAGSGASTVRLDAVGYAVKTAGSTCFMTPDTLAFVGELTAQARALGLEVLAEVHGHYRDAVQAAGRVDWVYDFALPPLILHALLLGDGRWLREWLLIRPRNTVTVLDTHDGIGIRDVAPGEAGPGPLPAAEVQELLAFIDGGAGREQSRLGDDVGGPADVYQVYRTVYDALGQNDGRYLLARLLQFFSPGVPQVYYVGMLAGGDDPAGAAQTGEPRDVNRRRYSEAEVRAVVRRPVVQALARLIRFRNAHPAFGGEFAVLDTPADRLDLRWSTGRDEARLVARLPDASFDLTFTVEGGRRTVVDLTDLPY